MRLSDIKGEKALDVMADAMELAEKMGEDGRVKALMDALKDADGRDDAWRVFCHHVPPLLRDAEYKPRIISILASASGVTYEEYAEDGPVLFDLFELVTSDAESLGFLIGSAAPKE